MISPKNRASVVLEMIIGLISLVLYIRLIITAISGNGWGIHAAGYYLIFLGIPLFLAMLVITLFRLYTKHLDMHRMMIVWGPTIVFVSLATVVAMTIK
jgi:hypothetical protein